MFAITKNYRPLPFIPNADALARFSRSFDAALIDYNKLRETYLKGELPEITKVEGEYHFTCESDFGQLCVYPVVFYTEEPLSARTLNMRWRVSLEVMTAGDRHNPPESDEQEMSEHQNMYAAVMGALVILKLNVAREVLFDDGVAELNSVID